MINNISKLKDWQIKKLPEVVFFQEGPGVRNNQYTQTGVKLLNVANLVEGQVVLENTNRYISEEEAYGKYNHFLVDEGDLIIASSGIKVEYFDKKMGFVKKEHLPLCMNTSTIRFKSLDNGNLNLKYFSYFLKSIYFKKQIARLITGSAQLNFGPSHLKQIDVIVPPINIQNNIINILDKSKYLIDKRKEQIEALDELVKSKFIEMFGDPVSNSKEWDVVKLGKISSVGSSKRVFVDELVNEGIPFYRGTEIGALSTGEKIEPTLFITKEHYEKLKDSTGVPAIGDLLMPSICPDGRIWSVDTEMPFYFKDGRVLWIHLENSSIDSMFLKHMLREKFNRDYNKIASGTTFAELKIFALKDLDIIMPPIEIQKKYSNFVKQTEKLKFEMEKSLKELEDNFNSLMQKAFKGELFN